MTQAHLLLSDGTVYTGTALGAIGTTTGESVFNTGMTGYQEILTDPSYAGQLVTLTYPLIGNYGITPNDFESKRVQVAGFVVREVSDHPSNWRSEGTLDGFLKEHGVVGISGVDTRELAKSIRSSGVMMAAISSELSITELKIALQQAPAYGDINFVNQVTTEAPYIWPASTSETKYRVALLDCGVKYNILRSLAALGAEVTVYPSNTTAAEILAANPDGVFLSPGPGDPELLTDVVENVKVLAKAKPTMGICLGNQLIGCAFGGHTFKLPFGHRGSNHPVKDLATGRVVITSQNHGYALAADGFSDPELEVWQINLNDGTVEGLRHKSLPIFTIQYHPEASPGPSDSNGYFAQFLRMIDESK